MSISTQMPAVMETPTVNITQHQTARAGTANKQQDWNLISSLAVKKEKAMRRRRRKMMKKKRKDKQTWCFPPRTVLHWYSC